jgi:hypothetical protein
MHLNYNEGGHETQGEGVKKGAWSEPMGRNEVKIFHDKIVCHHRSQWNGEKERYVPPHTRCLPTSLHRVTSQEIILFKKLDSPDIKAVFPVWTGSSSEIKFLISPRENIRRIYSKVKV